MTLGTSSLRLIEQGPLVEVEIKHHSLSHAELKDELGLWGEAAAVRLDFLVDTGARHTIVDQQVIDNLKIEPVTFINLETATGVLSDCPAYRVGLGINARNRRAELATTVVGLPAGRLLSKPGPRFRGILGRSSMQKLRFTYDGAAGTFELEVVS